MKKKLIILGVIIVLISAGCSSENELDKILKKENYTVVDVRTKEEYEQGHVKNAVNIPYDTINKNVALDKNKTILVYCKSGKRSSIAYDVLKDLGYNVYNLGAYNTITLEKE